MGTVRAIQISPSASAPMQELREVLAVEGQGLEGDRYFTKRGTYSAKPKPGRELTLISVEALEWMEREHGLRLTFAESRRNVLVEGVALPDLIGREFTVGSVRLRGACLSEPCRYLAELTRKDLVKPMVHRGGLNVEILAGGILRVGDEVRTPS